jgi:ABC-type lipoprotein release transport system permease subunit
VRNTGRNRRRSALTVLSVALGVAIFVVAQSFVDGIETSLLAIEVDRESAHVRVVPAGWLDDEDYFPIENANLSADAARAWLSASVPEARVTSRISFAAELSDMQESLRCRGLVVDPEDYGEVFALGLHAPKNGEPGVWVGAELAAAFGWKVGSRATIRARTAQGSYNAVTFIPVVGLLRTGHHALDAFSVILPPEVGLELLNLPSGSANELLIRLPRADGAAEVAAKLAAALPGVQTQTWEEKSAYVLQLNAVRRRVLRIVLGVLFLIAASAVANSALMSALERTREIGTLHALGLRSGGVVGLLTLESALLGAVGSIGGAAVGLGLSLWLSQRGLPIPVPVSPNETAVPMPAVLYFHFDPAMAFAGALIGTGLAAAAGSWPALRAARVAPAAALRGG